MLTSTNPTILNPFRLVRNNYKCLHHTGLRKYSFIKKFPLIPASIIMKILNKFIIDERNASNI